LKVKEPTQLLDFRPKAPPPRLAAVSYLNTLPLVWGFASGPHRDSVQLDFALPFECARRVASGQAKAGLMPVIEASRLGLPMIGDTGIACRGPVRSILLVSKVEPAQIKHLALDRASRTSVMLARILLAERYGATPELVTMSPELGPMLRQADAALIIGDPALRLDPATLPYHVLDLGLEWWEMTGLPMVFAMWAGEVALPETLFRQSLEFGRANMAQYLREEAAKREIPEALAWTYLQHHIVYDIGAPERAGLAEYLRLATALDRADEAVAESETQETIKK
jgi:chorismate dehydratase